MIPQRRQTGFALSGLIAGIAGVMIIAQSLVYGLVIIVAVALTRSRASGEIVK